ncbi:MAG: hypothetical protein ABIH26_14075 [Candidatus Eisenbacteria bacterium]
MAQYSVELDLDGIVGNAPDYIYVEQSDYVLVEVYLNGPNSVWVFGMFLCNFDRSLEFQSATFYSPGGAWSFPPVQPPDENNCITVQGQNFDFANGPPMVLPWHVATLEYHAAVDQSIDDLYMLTGSGVLTYSFSSFDFENCESVLGTVQIGDISTEETNWGAVKSLFR